MADLTADAALRFLKPSLKLAERWVLDNSAAQTIYKGHPMIIDIGTDTVYPRGFLDATTVVSTDIFIGIAAEPKTVLTTDTEIDNAILIYVWPTIIGFKSSVYTDADVGDVVYMSDSATLSSTAGDNPEIGELHRVLDGYAYIRLESPQICTGA